MWCRFELLVFCCLVVVQCSSGRDESQDGRGSQVTSEGRFGQQGNSDSGRGSTSSLADSRGSPTEGRSSDSQRNYDQRDNGNSRRNSNEGSSFSRPIQNFGNSGDFETHSSVRPTGQSNRENNQHSGFTSNNREQSSRPSTHDRENENHPNRPGYGGQSVNSPFGSSSSNRPGNEPFSNRPQGGSSHGHEYNSNSEKGHSSGRPTGSSSLTTGGLEGTRPGFDNQQGRPTGGSSLTTGGHEGSRPGFDNQHGRPTGGSSLTTGGHEGSRPGFDNQHGRPTGGSSLTTGGHEGSRPGFDNQHGRPTGGSLNQNEGSLGSSGFRPSNEMGQFNRPTSESGHHQQGGSHHEGQSGHGSKPNQQTGDSNHEISGNDKNDGKEDEKDVCFPNLGCFKMGKPWKSVLRPIGPPHGPERIQTTIHFYSRDNLEKPINITMYPQINMNGVRFDPSKITAIIVHGFSNSGNATWMKDMKNAYLKKVDANVMIVDWGKGAQLLNYFQVAGNTRVVGKQLGLFVKHLRDNYRADPGKFHLIGHSLGAQICSYLGKEVQGIARLTALDPAQPGFEGFDSELRLDKNDAEFVDVVHTDARPFIPTLGFGMLAPHGHVDFYMNGGYDQPGCVPPPKKELPSIKNVLDLTKFPVEVIAKTVACPHARAYEYLIEAFNETEKCIFWGHKADVKTVFMSVTNTVTQGLLKKITALSSSCSKEDCIPLGFATKKSPLRGVFVVTTGNRPPYCVSEPGIPPETLPQESKQEPQESYIQKIGRKTGLTG